MDKKFILTCFITGVATTILTYFLLGSGFWISFIGTLLMPGFLFGLVISNYFTDVSAGNKVKFTLTCFFVYSIAAILTFFFNAGTNGIALILTSTLTLPLIVEAFDGRIKKLKSKNKLIIALTCGCIAGLILFILNYYLKESGGDNFQGENGAMAIYVSQLLIFPLWQTAFALTVRVDNNT